MLPYVWVVEQGTLARAVISWELAFACRDRARAWRVLQELAGTENAFVRRAAEEAKRAAETAADERIAKIEADFAVALSTERDKGATEAIERLVWKLANPGGVEQVITAAAGASAPAPAPTPAPETTAEASAGPTAVPSEPPAAAPPPAAAAAGVSPYIDSFLCTSCNDCINLNPQMFRYNADKQAEIADASAGTFKQLVKAAEACPARCIHPGDPRPGDSTATPALVKRAAKFN